MIRKIFCIFIILGLISVSGCKVSDDVKKNLLEKDSSFRAAYQTKKDTQQKISRLKEDFKKEKKKIDADISRLKLSQKEAKAALYTKTGNLNRSLKPYIDMLKSDLEALYADCRTNKSALKMAEKKINEIKKLIEKKKDLNLTHDEVSVWNKRKATLEKEKGNTLKSLNLLRGKIKVKKLELKILKE